MDLTKRIKEEFYCDVSGGGCGKYFDTYLRDNMTGDYTIQCPACKHHHFRIIRKGLVTSDRSQIREAKNIILGLECTLRNTPSEILLTQKKKLLSLV